MWAGEVLGVSVLVDDELVEDEAVVQGVAVDVTSNELNHNHEVVSDVLTAGSNSAILVLQGAFQSWSSRRGVKFLLLFQAEEASNTITALILGCQERMRIRILLAKADKDAEKQKQREIEEEIHRQRDELYIPSLSQSPPTCSVRDVSLSLSDGGGHSMSPSNLSSLSPSVEIPAKEDSHLKAVISPWCLNKKNDNTRVANDVPQQSQDWLALNGGVFTDLVTAVNPVTKKVVKKTP